jgi:hypothetical protein
MKKALLSAIFTILALATCNSQTLAADSREAHVGLPQDWSSRQLLHPGPVVGAPMNGQFRDPRVIYGQLQQQHNLKGRELLVRRNLSVKTAPGTMHRDWSFTLGPGGGMADGMSPAKYSFDVNATPSCANDFVIYTVASGGASNTPNIVGFNNLYSGTSTALTVAAATTGATESGNTVTITTTTVHGMVAGQQVTISGVAVAGYNGTFTILAAPTTTTFTYTDASSGLASSGGGTATPRGICGATPLVKWAYNASSASGTMSTSPVLALNGTQVGFVEGVSGGPSVFHALTLDPAGAGSFNTGTNVYSAATPGTMTSLTLTGSKNVTLSSPWVDYATNSAYVGDDNGTLYHITCVFGCASSTLDYSCTVATGKILSGPVFDQTSQAVFVGASDGKLYRMTGGSACTPASIVVGDGASTGSGIAAGILIGGVNDSPLVDSVFQTVFATSGRASGSAATVLVETGTGIGSAKSFTTALATITNGSANYVVHDGIFTDAYYNNVSGTTVAPTGTFIGCAANNSGAPFLYTSPFTNPNSGTNTPLSPSNPPIVGTSSSSNPPGNANAGCSPITEFNNGSDRVFFGNYLSQATKCGGVTTGCLYSNALSAGTPGTTYGNSPQIGGTSGITIDNVSNVNGSGQTSSIYFSNLGSSTCSNAGTSSTGHCAVKLTQSSLQ